MIKASIILAFYNDIALLQLILSSLQKQYTGQFEVLIADDGSTEESVRQAKQMLSECRFQSHYFWHADEGFRKTAVMNRAVVHANGEVLIFVDADCVPQDEFVDDHLTASSPGFCLAGRRVDCFREAVSLMDCTQPEAIVRKNAFRLFCWSLRSKAKNVEKGLRLPRRLARTFSTRRWGLVGCNFSVWKSDLMAVNGFDERHNIPWGAEDSDIERRLSIFGVKVKDLRYQATMIHFDASFFKRKAGISESQRLGHLFFKQVSSNESAWTAFGIKKLDSAK